METQGGGIQFVAYNAKFAVPSKESGSGNNLYYSFNAGGVHFVILASYTDYNVTSWVIYILYWIQPLLILSFGDSKQKDFPLTGEQYKWLEKDLKKVDRSVTPWLIASWHSPWYNSYSSHYQEFECMRQHMEDLLYEYGVDLAFHGHVRGH